MFIRTPAIAFLANFDLLLRCTDAHLSSLCLLAVTGHKLVYFAYELSRVEIVMMLLKHADECVEVRDEGFGLRDGKGANIWLWDLDLLLLFTHFKIIT
jgi:hypothetical protein